MKKRQSAEQIVGLLHQADVALGKVQKVPEVCKQLGISEQTYDRWRTKSGGMDPQMARQLPELQKENIRLKCLVADQALDNQILREAARQNWPAPSNDVERWKPFGVTWSRRRCRNDGSAACWDSLARRSVIAVGSQTMCKAG